MVQYTIRFGNVDSLPVKWHIIRTFPSQGWHLGRSLKRKWLDNNSSRGEPCDKQVYMDWCVWQFCRSHIVRPCTSLWCSLSWQSWVLLVLGHGLFLVAFHWGVCTSLSCLHVKGGQHSLGDQGVLLVEKVARSGTVWLMSVVGIQFKDHDHDCDLVIIRFIHRMVLH